MPRSLKTKNGYLIVGMREIANHLGITRITVYNWVKKHGFPAMKLPNGQRATTEGLIDLWLMAREEQYRNVE